MKTKMINGEEYVLLTQAETNLALAASIIAVEFWQKKQEGQTGRPFEVFCQEENKHSKQRDAFLDIVP